jgi:hypothetical protein
MTLEEAWFDASGGRLAARNGQRPGDQVHTRRLPTLAAEVHDVGAGAAAQVQRAAG